MNFKDGRFVELRGVTPAEAERLRQERPAALMVLWLAKRAGYKIQAQGRVTLCYSTLDLSATASLRNWDDWLGFVDRLSEAQAYVLCIFFAGTNDV